MKNRSFLLIVLLVFSLLIAACGNSDSDSDDADKDDNKDQPKTDVSIQLAWTHEYSSSPIYAAVENGHFADENLNVTLISGGFSEEGYVEPIAEVVSGEGNFGLSSTSSLIEARANGQPVVAVLTILQRSPFALISLSDAEIETPGALVGKTVSVTDGSARMAYDALLISQDIPFEDVNTQSRISFGVEPLLEGEVDVLGGWVINEGIQIEEAGLEPTYILFSDYGIDEYSFTVFTTEEMINSNPELVNAVVDAIIAGMADVIADPQQATDFVIKYAPELDHDEQLTHLQAMLPLLNIPNTPLGLMDESVWQSNHQLLLDNNVIESEIDISAVYTNRFVEGD